MSPSITSGDPYQSSYRTALPPCRSVHHYLPIAAAPPGSLYSVLALLFLFRTPYSSVKRLRYKGSGCEEGLFGILERGPCSSLLERGALFGSPGSFPALFK